MDLKVPHLGEGADSGTVVNLFVKEGDQIEKDAPVLELENEKAVATIPSLAAGTVEKLFVKAGEKINVGQRILSLKESGNAEPQAAAIAEKPQPAKEAGPASQPARKPAAPAQPAAPRKAVSDAEIAASPSLRKLARDLGIDLTRVNGSQRGGRINLEDIRAYIEELQNQAHPPAPAQQTGAAPEIKPLAEAIDFSKWGPVTKSPLTPLRQVIARRMLESWNAVPHVTQFDEADITDLMALSKKHAPAFEKQGTKLTLTVFTLKLIVDVLKKHLLLNSSIDEVNNEVVRKDYFHIGIAVDTEAGLMVPVLRDVDKKDMLQLAKELEALAKRARERKVSADELKGGSFTISNQGGVGGAHFTPIVNKPEVAILGLGRGAMKAVVREGRIEPRLMLPLALSYDHRLIDGGYAARFIVELTRAFQSFPEQLISARG